MKDTEKVQLISLGLEIQSTLKKIDGYEVDIGGYRLLNDKLNSLLNDYIILAKDELQMKYVEELRDQGIDEDDIGVRLQGTRFDDRATDYILDITRLDK